MCEEIFCENSIGLLILAGGLSSRMGRDKVKLDIGGRSFGEHIALNMGKYPENIFSANDGSKLEGFLTVADEESIKGRGPAAGIASALEICKSRWLMVVPCDVPFADVEIPLKLWQKAREQDAPRPVLAQGARGMEPLIGLYPKTSAGIMRSALLKNVRKVSDILELIGYDSVIIDDIKLVNVNNPEDYEMVRERYEKRRYCKIED